MSWDDRISPAIEAHGETVTYYPVSGGSRSISAIVKRDALRSTPGAGRSVSPGLRVTVRNNATTGISTTELRRRADKLSVREMVGGDAVQRLILDVVSQDSWGMELELA